MPRTGTRTEPPAAGRPPLRGAAAAAVALLAASPAASAYLDPGTGTLLVQAAIGTLVGGLVAVKLYWIRIRRRTRRLLGRDTGTARTVGTDGDAGREPREPGGAP